jgi:transcriptional regulator with XRE-family HTH domain
MIFLIWLKYFREKNGKSQKNLAEAVGVQENTVWRWENNKAVPSANFIDTIAKFFNVSVDELLNGPAANELKINIIWTREEIDMNVLSIKPNEVNFACKPKEIILWGSFSSDLTPDQVAEQVKNEFIAACEGNSVRDAARKKLNEGLEGGQER